MTKYDKLNNYLNRVFNMLMKNDQFLISNLFSFDCFCQELSKALANVDINMENVENKLTYKDILDLSREIIASIDIKYLPIFNKMVVDGTLDFSYKNEYKYSHVSLIDSENIKLININRRFNYSDVVSLIHEFFHFTNLQFDASVNQYILTEFISIYFETYTINYLKNKGVPYNELIPNDRIEDLIDCINSYQCYSPILIAYNSFGDINDDSLKYMNKYFFDYSQDEFEEDIDDLLYYFDYQEEEYYNGLTYDDFNQDILDYSVSTSIMNNYRYLLGTILAFYAINNCDIKKIIDLNDHINSTYCDVDILELLEAIGITMDEQLISTSIQNMLDFISDNNRKVK